MAASSSARICNFRFSSIPLEASNLPFATTLPKALLVDDKAVTPDLTFFWLLLKKKLYKVNEMLIKTTNQKTNQNPVYVCIDNWLFR